MTETPPRRRRACWIVLTVMTAAGTCLVFAGVPALRHALWHSVGIAHTATVEALAPTGTSAVADPAASDAPSSTLPLPPGLTVHEPPASAPDAVTALYARRSGVFGLAAPAADPERILFAPAQASRPNGPESVRPTKVGPYVTMRLARGAQIRVTAPIATSGVADYVHGIEVSPAGFAELYRTMAADPGLPVLDRAHMFWLSFDKRGDVTGLRQVFSP